MMQGVTRRLEKLETTMGTGSTFDLAGTLEATRKRVHFVTPEQLRQDQEQRLATMRAAHAVKPLRGLERWMMESLERACAREPPQTAPSSPATDAPT